MSKRIDNNQIIEDVISTINKTDSLLRTSYSVHGKYSAQLIRNRFGGWNKLLLSLGYSPEVKHQTNITKEDIILDVIKVFNKTGKTNRETYISNGKYSISAIRHRFGSWNLLLSSIDLKINMHKNISADDIIDDFKKVSLKHKSNSAVTYRKYGKYSQCTIDRLFGSHSGLLRLLKLPVYGRQITDEEIFESVYSIYNEYGFIGAEILNQNCIVSHPTLVNRFGSLQNLSAKLNIPLFSEDDISKFSKYVLDISTMILGSNFFLEYTFDWLINPETGRHLRIDIYYPDLKLAIEADHSQHYVYIPFFHKNEQAFDDYRSRDRLKDSLLSENSISVIRISYNDSYNSIVSKLSSFI